MTYEDYSNLAAEMNILFRYMDDDLIARIPQKIIEFFQDIASPTFRSKIDPRYPLDQQILLPSTENMLVLLYRQYWCTPEEREIIDKALLENAEEYQASVNNIFDKIENDETTIFTEEISSSDNLPTVEDKNIMLEKIKEFLNYITEILKNLFNKNND